jgi:hypothetical protein
MVVRKSRKRTRCGPSAEIDERALAAAGAKAVPHFGRTISNFMNENSKGAGSQYTLAGRLGARRRLVRTANREPAHRP